MRIYLIDIPRGLGVCTQPAPSSSRLFLINTFVSPRISAPFVTYDHTHWKAQDPVRSPIDNPVRARLVAGSVTTSESLVLYVFCRFASVV